MSSLEYNVPLNVAQEDDDDISTKDSLTFFFTFSGKTRFYFRIVKMTKIFGWLKKSFEVVPRNKRSKPLLTCDL